MSKSLFQLEQEANEVMQEIFEAFDQNTGEQVADDTDAQQALALLENQIQIKMEGYAYVLKQKFPELKKTIKKRQDELKRELAHLDRQKERMELAMHNIAAKKGGTIELPEEGYVVADHSVRRSVNEAAFSDKERTYSITGLSNEAMEFVCNHLSHTEYSYSTCVEKINVTSLPQDHPAIIKNIRPTVKFLKHKPKEKTCTK